MRIIALSDEYENLYCQCLEDWSDDIKEGGDHKKRWFQQMKDKGLGVRLALDENGVVGGMIQYLPVEHTLIEGENMYFILCVWVHGHKKGRGNFQKKGMGKALLQAAEDDVRERGAKAIVAWGLSLPFWMKASWFKKRGYKKVDKNGIQVLLWKPFTNDAVAPKLIKPKKKPELSPDKVTVTAFLNGWCPAQNMTYERAKRAAAQFGDNVKFQTIDTFDRATAFEWGIWDEVFIENKKITSGPPLSYEKIKRKIARKVKKLK